MNESDANKLCLSCGMCCNGVIFADVELRAGDKPNGLRDLGMKLKPKGAKQCFAQPCTALDGCRCQIYADRPKYCREFDCVLLKNLQADKMGLPAALRVVGVAHKRAETVRKLLRLLGDTEESLALSKRFQKMRKRIETQGCDEATADLFGELTLAVHDLNVLISEAFYR